MQLLLLPSKNTCQTCRWPAAWFCASTGCLIQPATKEDVV
jgi:hypothetical protein